MENCLIYGVDANEKITPIMVRDAIIECFAQAHSAELEDLRISGSDDEMFENLKKMNAEMLIKKYFAECGGDFEAPTKEKILEVVGKLMAFAKKFRNQETVMAHAQKIMPLIEKL